MKYLLALVTVFAVGFFTTLPSGNANAANKNDFNPGYIIDDYVFYNAWAMDTNQIQNFLNAKNPNCDYWGTQPASDWGRSDITHAQLAEYKRNGTNGYSQDSGFHAPPYRCLTQYTQSTPQMEAASGYCSAIGAGNRSAAQIINDVAKACGINPQVLIILLEKEQSLITDDWPLNRQLQKATGFACPDTAPCNPAYEGFFYQVYNAARQFKVYKAFPNSYNYRAGRANNIYWNPDKDRCGSSSVYIQNQATAALYIYTPYRPNEAALNNLYGTGDSCSSYGNRNFWRIFTDWFGSTKISFTNLDSPRWMQIKNDTKKLNVPSNTTIDPVLTAGRQAYFVDKIQLNGKWYARTTYDKTNNNLDVIPVDDLQEIPITPITSKWVSIPNAINKINPLRQTNSDRIEAMSATKVVDKIIVNGIEYYRTEYDKSMNYTKFITVTDTEDFKLYEFETPRVMVTTRTVDKVNVQTGQVVGQVPANTPLFFSGRITTGGIVYAQPESERGSLHAINSSVLKNLTSSSSLFVPLDEPRWMQLSSTTSKVNMSTQENTGPSLVSGTQAYFKDKILIEDSWYARTAYDSSQKTLDAIPVDDIIDIPIAATTPVWVSIPSATYKIDPVREKKYESISGSVAAQVVDKITVNGVEYYRTPYEQSLGQYRFIPVSATETFTFYSFTTPRTMITKRATTKINVQTNASGAVIAYNTPLMFNRKITIGGVEYAQIQSDNGTLQAIKVSDLKEAY